MSSTKKAKNSYRTYSFFVVKLYLRGSNERRDYGKNKSSSSR